MHRFRNAVEKNAFYDGMSTTRLSFDELPAAWAPGLMPQLEEFLENTPENSPLRSLLPLEREPFKDKMGELIAQFKKECGEYCNEAFLRQVSEEMLNDISIEKDGKIWLGGNAYPIWPVLHHWFGWWFFQAIRMSLDISSATFVSEKKWKKEMGDTTMGWKAVNEYCASRGGKLVHRHELISALQKGTISLSQPEWCEGGCSPCILTPEDMGVRNTFGLLSGGTCFRYM